MTSRFSDKSGDQSPRGFSLVELAIVVCVMGIILAGLWGLTQKIYEDSLRERTAQQVGNVVANIREFYKIRPDAAGLTTNFAVERQMIPSDMVDSRVVPYTARTAIGGGFDVINAAGVTFQITLDSLNREQCVHLAVKLTGGGPSGWTNAAVNAFNTMARIPVSGAGSADAACANPTNNTITMTYRLRDGVL